MPHNGLLLVKNGRDTGRRSFHPYRSRFAFPVATGIALQQKSADQHKATTEETANFTRTKNAIIGISDKPGLWRIACMKHQAKGLKANGVWGFAFTPSTTAFDFPALPVAPAKQLRG
ncbi:MAG: hypothetical protein A2X82_12405 [Geobacteraceae bacterium GWC2_55_20]|nr:MAG: hypothetical protein A2X82_12405 [Geobacteraceae bacterium GWC2_55_20]OGU23723.1 MAG: hypothetical protein A2X85_12240 [Geobacteraceae bacterium GWF2_54_21]HBB92082.1 hypothetical protein [Bacteroidales bacterium]HCE67705.1 hypothetical protein [Geobacter sp.]